MNASDNSPWSEKLPIIFLTVVWLSFTVLLFVSFFFLPRFLICLTFSLVVSFFLVFSSEGGVGTLFLLRSFNLAAAAVCFFLTLVRASRLAFFTLEIFSLAACFCASFLLGSLANPVRTSSSCSICSRLLGFSPGSTTTVSVWGAFSISSSNSSCGSELSCAAAARGEETGSLSSTLLGLVPGSAGVPASAVPAVPVAPAVPAVPVAPVAPAAPTALSDSAVILRWCSLR